MNHPSEISETWWRKTTGCIFSWSWLWTSTESTSSKSQNALLKFSFESAEYTLKKKQVKLLKPVNICKLEFWILFPKKIVQFNHSGKKSPETEKFDPSGSRQVYGKSRKSIWTERTAHCIIAPWIILKTSHFVWSTGYPGIYSPSGTIGSNPTGSPPSCMTTDSSLAPLDQDWKAWHVVLEADSGQQKYARCF